MTNKKKKLVKPVKKKQVKKVVKKPLPTEVTHSITQKVSHVDCCEPTSNEQTSHKSSKLVSLKESLVNYIKDSQNMIVYYTRSVSWSFKLNYQLSKALMTEFVDSTVFTIKHIFNIIKG